MAQLTHKKLGLIESDFSKSLSSELDENKYILDSTNRSSVFSNSGEVTLELVAMTLANRAI
jgi:hypothetical protein